MKFLTNTLVLHLWHTVVGIECSAAMGRVGAVRDPLDGRLSPFCAQSELRRRRTSSQVFLWASHHMLRPIVMLINNTPNGWSL